MVYYLLLLLLSLDYVDGDASVLGHAIESRLQQAGPTGAWLLLGDGFNFLIIDKLALDERELKSQNT